MIYIFGQVNNLSVNCSLSLCICVCLILSSVLEDCNVCIDSFSIIESLFSRSISKYRCCCTYSSQSRLLSNEFYLSPFRKMSRGSPQQQTHSESGNSSSYHSGSSMSTSQLYPLAGLIEDVLTQEGELWGRNETMLQTLRCECVCVVRGCEGCVCVGII